jgi:capsular exopolysaccharide synthesis family protein
VPEPALAPRALAPSVPVRSLALPPVLNSQLTAVDLLKGLRRHLGLAMGLGLILAIAAAAATWSFLPMGKWTAQSLLQLSAAQPKIVFDEANQSVSSVLEYKNFQKTQEVLIKSPFVLNQALRDPAAAKLPAVRKELDPVSWLAKKLDLTFTGEVLSIEVAGNSAYEATTLVNAVTDAYLSEVVNAERKRRVSQADMLKDIWDRYQKNLKAQRIALRRLSDAAGTNDPETLALKHRLLQDHQAGLRRDLATAQSDVKKAELELAMLTKRSQLPKEPIPRSAIADAVNRDATTQDFMAQLQAAQNKLQDYARRTRKGSDPAMAKQRGKVKELQVALKEHRDKLAADLVKGHQEATNTDVTEGKLLAEKLKYLRSMAKELEDEIATAEKNLRGLNKDAMDLADMKAEIQSAEEAASKVGAQREVLAVELDAPPRVNLLIKATEPKVMTITKHLAATGLAAMASLFLTCFGIAFWETRVRRVNSVEEVSRGLGMNLVGVLPALPAPSRQRPGRNGSEPPWNNMLLESVDAMRALILHTSRSEPLQVLMVASAVKGEGKTSLASHLATSLARARRRTLLIDCDLRSPAIHRVFDVLPSPGVCEVLRGEVSLDEAVQPTVAAGLSILSAGRCEILALQGLAQNGLQAVIDAARSQFDYIVVDSAPVLPVADSLQVCQHVDAVIFSVLRDVSRLAKVHAAYERLGMLGVRMLGAVVAGARCEDYDSRYAYQTTPADSLETRQ